MSQTLNKELKGDSRTAYNAASNYCEKLFKVPEKKPENIPYEEIKKITGTAGLRNNGYLEVNIYNGSKFNIKNITLNYGKSEDEVRSYKNNVEIPSQSAEMFMFKVVPEKDFSWSISTAEGVEADFDINK